jgi:hypothetical protein
MYGMSAMTRLVTGKWPEMEMSGENASNAGEHSRTKQNRVFGSTQNQQLF